MLADIQGYLFKGVLFLRLSTRDATSAVSWPDESRMSLSSTANAFRGKFLTPVLAPKELLTLNFIYTNYNINVSNIQTSKYDNLQYLLVAGHRCRLVNKYYRGIAKCNEHLNSGFEIKRRLRVRGGSR